MNIQKHFPQALRSDEGFLIMLSVLIVSAVGVAIATSVLLLGTSSSRTSFANEQSAQARSLADTCAEEALERIRKDSTYTGTVTITLGQGTCTYSVTNTGGENRTINASSTVDAITRKVQVFLDDVTPQINATSWQEIGDF